MKILRVKNYSSTLSSTEKPTGLDALNPTRKSIVNSNRWKEFNKETGGKRYRLNAGETRKEYNSWQQNKYGNII